MMTPLQESLSTPPPSRSPREKAARDPSGPPEDAHPLPSPRLRRFLIAMAEAAMPAGSGLEGGGLKAAVGVLQWLKDVPPVAATTFRGACLALDGASLIRRGRPFASLSLEDRAALLLFFEQSRHYAIRTALRTVLTPLKFAHFDRPEMFAHVGCRYELDVVQDEEPRWLAQVINGREVSEDLDIECEVVVIGTGAGGAAAAYELASRGRAVLMLEEGDYHRRSSMRGNVTHAMRDLYRDRGVMVALGNVGIPMFAGRAVGGTTVINSGTCYRTPDRVLREWQVRLGLPSDFSAEGLGPYYERVESMLQVAPASPLHLGQIGPIIARGAERLGLQHGPLRRNAPDCDGQGICCFGCPTGAKRSTDVSYVPEALKRGAQLVTAARAEAIHVFGGRARGVTAQLAGGRRLNVKAGAVIVAGGAFLTPLLLRQAGASRHPWLGKNLSIHPASKVFALFNERVDQSRGIPQGYSIDHYLDQGLMFEGGSLPLNIVATGAPWTGKRYMDLMAQYPYLATFGLMVKDESRGEVRRGLNGSPLILYNLGQRDLKLLQHGIATLCEVFQRAGATRVLPLLPGHDEVNTKEALEALRSARLKPGDLELTAYHPLGTCRIGADPETSCLDPDHEVRGAKGLYVCDGSAIPTSIGVNPQMTIMAMALRAAEIIDSRLG